MVSMENKYTVPQHCCVIFNLHLEQDLLCMDLCSETHGCMKYLVALLNGKRLAEISIGQPLKVFAYR